jgi:hypothetical protein
MRGSVIVLNVLMAMFVHPLTVNMSGTWKCQINWNDGTQGSPVFAIQQRDEKINGTYVGGLGRFSILGTIKGSVVEFDVEGGRMHVSARIDKDGVKVTGIATVRDGDGSIACSKQR